MNLQGISLETLFKNIPRNSHTQPYLEDFFEKYMIENPKCLIKHINKTGLYNVFFRTSDKYCSDEYFEFRRHYSQSYHEICYLQSFTTFNEANEWVIKKGKKIISEEEKNRDRPILLTIIHCKNNSYDGNAGEEPVCLYQISSCQHPTYAFSEKGFKMALDEHYVMYIRNKSNITVPNWIQYINDNGEIIRSPKNV
jgi:hypothetical protein